MFRKATEEESLALIEQAARTDPWKPGEAEELLGGVLKSYFSGELGEGHYVCVWESEEEGVVGWSYYAANHHAPGTWDVWWIGTDSKKQRRGYGTQLLTAIEADIASKAGRVIVIETSATSPLEKARRFYPARGYRECGRIPNFYAPDDDKVIFAKTL